MCVCVCVCVSVVCVCVIIASLSIHLLRDLYFHVLAVVNNAVVNIRGAYIFSNFYFYFLFFSDMLGIYLIYFLEKPPYHFHDGYTSLHSHHWFISLAFSPHFHQYFVNCRLFDKNHSDRRKIVSRGFHLHFPDD